jgi:oligosaccharide repeat unit polymerase
MAVVFLIYTNIPVIAKHTFGLHEYIAGSFILLLFLPLIVYLAFRREKLIIDHVLILLIAFLVILLISSLFAKDIDIALRWVVVFVVEGLVLYFLIVNVVRSLETLKRIIWVLLLAGTLLGSLTLYQKITHSYKNQFGGLALGSVSEGGDEFSDGGSALRNRMVKKSYRRAGGPFGAPNRYGQIMVVLMPFGMFMFWMQRSWSLKIIAGLSLILITCGALLTYSRGAFVAMVLLLLFMTFMRYIRIHQFIGILVFILVLMVVAAPGYFGRIQSLRGIGGLFSEESNYRPDGTTRSRTTEMLAALLAFIDHPLLGVGPGQYTPFYSKEYQLKKSIAFRHIDKSRRAHTLYFELAAETGVFGLIIFMATVLYIMWQLSKLRQQESSITSENSYIATAFLLSIVGYLGTAIFLHFAFQRYYWLILSLSSAAVHILRSKQDKENDALQLEQ